MKTMLMILALSPVLALSGENPVPKDPFAAPDPKRAQSDLSISKIDLKAGQSLQDAIQQITAGLSPEARKKFVVDIPEAELGKMRIERDLRVHDVPLVVGLLYLRQVAPVGCSPRHGVWHISTERPEDVIAVEYRMRKSGLFELGISIEPNGMLLTKSGRMWPSGVSSGSGEWKATYTADEPEADGLESGVLRVLATRRFHDEIDALLLLRSRGYNGLSFGG